ncbi:hypothetical protein L195_g040995, partial [Trifolium pratense]
VEDLEVEDKCKQEITQARLKQCKIDLDPPQLTQKKVEFQWTDACEESFQKLKQCLTSAHVLALPTSDGGYLVYCDASRVGLGSVLM